jgi:hypothetical protein
LSHLNPVFVSIPIQFSKKSFVLLLNRDINLSVFFDSCLSSEDTIISHPATVCYQPTLIRLYRNGSVIRGFPVAPQNVD